MGVSLSWLENDLPIHAHFFQRAIFTCKVCKTVSLTCFLACDQGSLVGLWMQDYKSLCAAVTICSTLVNIQTHIHIHRQHFGQLIWKSQPAKLKKSKQENEGSKQLSPVSLENDKALCVFECSSKKYITDSSWAQSLAGHCRNDV